MSLAELPLVSAALLGSTVADMPRHWQEMFADPACRFLRTEAGALVVFRNADIRALAAQPDIGNCPADILSGRQQTEDGVAPAGPETTAIYRMVSRQFFTFNPPLHRPTRMAIARHFMPNQVEAMQPLAHEVAAETIGRVAGQGEIDFVTTFSGMVAAGIFGRLLDMSEAEIAQVNAALLATGPLFDIEMDEARLPAADAAIDVYNRVVAAAGNRALARGTNALVNSVEGARAALPVIDDPGLVGITPDSVGHMLASNLFDAFHTVATAAATAVYAVFTRQEVLAQVRADDSLVSAAVAEALRLYPPLTVTKRYALGEVTYEGLVIPRGTLVTMLWEMGNRDPDVFAEPDAFRLNRRMASETTFGGGAHICPGRYVARMIGEAVVRQLTRPGVTVALSEACSWAEGSVFRYLRTMPVTVTVQ